MSKSKESGETTAEETIDTTTETTEMPVENIAVTTEKVTTKKAKVALNSGKETTAAKKIGLSKFLEATPQKHGMVAILKRKCALEFKNIFYPKVTFELKDKALSSSILSEGKKTKETKAKGLKVFRQNMNFKKKSKVKQCLYKNKVLIFELGGVK